MTPRDALTILHDGTGMVPTTRAHHNQIAAALQTVAQLIEGQEKDDAPAIPVDAPPASGANTPEENDPDRTKVK